MGRGRDGGEPGTEKKRKYLESQEPQEHQAQSTTHKLIWSGRLVCSDSVVSELAIISVVVEWSSYTP